MTDQKPESSIGIGIIDVYGPEELEKCYNSIPEHLKQHVEIVSNTASKPVFGMTVKYFDKEVPPATLRNYLLAELRVQEYKHLFLIHSNVEITDPKVFENTVKTAETFGTWFILGPGANSVPIEDDEAGVTLHLTPELNDNFLYLYTGVIKNNGYFDERFVNSKNLDVLDYILKLRKKGIYTPAHYNPSIEEGITISTAENKKIGFLDMPNSDRSVQLSYAFFAYTHKYIPGQNEPPGVTQEQLLQAVEFLQKNYAKKNIL